MCDAQNERIIQSVVTDFVAAEKQFTAFDVTTEAKKQGATERHRDMKNAVHAIWGDMQGQSYARSLINLPGISIRPWLYYPDNTDPLDYVNAYQGADPQADDVDVDVDTDDDDDDSTAPIPIPIPMNTASGRKGVQVDGADEARVCVTQCQGRLNIPRKFLNAIGCSTGTEVIYIDTGIGGNKREMSIARKNDVVTIPQNSTTMGYEKAGVRCQLRVSASYLALSMMDKGTEFVVSRKKNIITITPK